MNLQDLLELIEVKRQEIERYAGVLERYQSGRWYDMGRRHMDELIAELASLTTQLPPEEEQQA